MKQLETNDPPKAQADEGEVLKQFLTQQIPRFGAASSGELI
jgi:hypothetical protein